jgi:hypothetical protein
MHEDVGVAKQIGIRRIVPVQVWQDHLGHRARIDAGATKAPLQDRPVGVRAGIEDDQFARRTDQRNGWCSEQEFVRLGWKTREEQLDCGRHGQIPPAVNAACGRSSVEIMVRISRPSGWNEKRSW